jgi:hypothetical protein
MISVHNYRSNGGPEVLLVQLERPLEEALRQLCVFELGYGGVLSKATEALIEVKTDIMGCRDRTVFAGPPEEMEQLFMALLLWNEAEKKVSFDEWWKRVSEMTDGNPLLVKLSAPIVKADLIFKELEKMKG